MKYIFVILSWMLISFGSSALLLHFKFDEWVAVLCFVIGWALWLDEKIERPKNEFDKAGVYKLEWIDADTVRLARSNDSNE